MTIVEEFVTDRGRTRRRRVVVDRDTLAAQFRQPTSIDRRDWAISRTELQRIVGEGRFAIWLEPLTLRASAPSGPLLLDGPTATWGWVVTRFGRLFERVSSAMGRELRLVDDRERQLLDALLPTPTPAAYSGEVELMPHDTQRRPDHEEVV